MYALYDGGLIDSSTSYAVNIDIRAVHSLPRCGSPPIKPAITIPAGYVLTLNVLVHASIRGTMFAIMSHVASLVVPT